jgi:hypothetical protein
MTKKATLQAASWLAAAGFLLAANGFAFGDAPAIKANAFAEAFDKAAKENHLENTAKLEKCKSGFRFRAWCRYRISPRTIIVVTARTTSAPARTVTILTSGKDNLAPIAAENEPLWLATLQILSPEQTPEQRKDSVNKLLAAVKGDRAGITATIGAVRYSAFADPKFGIWLDANLSATRTVTERIRNWRKQFSDWRK